MRIIARGAEAIIYERGDTIIKFREKKGYRIPEIDALLRTSRTRYEFKILQTCARAGLRVPLPIKIAGDNDKILMQNLGGISFDSVFSVKKMREVGELVALMHNLGVINGDLTTANMLSKENKIFLIDFGLGYFSKKDEDIATDIFLLKSALKSRHPDEHMSAYELFIEAYKTVIEKEFKGIAAHLKDIERRGRYHENG